MRLLSHVHSKVNAHPVLLRRPIAAIFVRAFVGLLAGMRSTVHGETALVYCAVTAVAAAVRLLSGTVRYVSDDAS